MYTPDESNHIFTERMRTVSLVDYGDIKKDDIVDVLEYIQAPLGSCSYYKTTIDGSKIHYLYTAEVSLESF